MRILLVEDDELLVDVLVQTLTGQRYVVDVVEDGQLGWEYAQSTNYDLILMDVGLPKLDGISLCRRLRFDHCTAPILLMTAKDASSDRIRGLDAGADDYVTKPLDLAELQARVRALLRRTEGGRSPVLQVGALCLDPSICQVTYAEQPLTLTPKEYSLLELFLRNPSRVFSRGQIIEHLWTFDDPPQEDSVKAHIKGLRQRLRAAGAVDWIENVYGLGYRLKEGVGGSTGESKSATPSQAMPKVTSEATSEAMTPDMAQPSKAQQFNQAMDGLWVQSQGLMTERLTVLQQAIAAIATQTLTPDLQQSAERAAHKLAGVLGMFDREEGTAIARQMEQLLALPTLNSQQTDSLRSHLHKLEAILALSPGVSAATAPPVASPQTPSSASIQVLVVDDDPVFLAALGPILEPWGIGMTGLEDSSQFWQVLPQVNPDLLILDLEMPKLNGIELCQSVRANPDWQALPILFLTAHRESEKIQQIFAAGADDYVTKPIVGPELLTRITNRLERIRFLQTLSSKDPLTGLANQPQSQRELERWIRQAEGDRQPFCLVLLVAESLRQINLQQGHATGNQVLQQWGRLFQSALSDGVGLGYWGDGEFGVGIASSAGETRDRLSDLLKTLRQQIFTAPDGTRFQVGCQVAIAPYPEAGETLQALYQTAVGQLAPPARNI